MNGLPVMLRPDGASRIIAFGTTGIICQNNRHPDQVIKAPLRHKLDGCDADTTETTLHGEKFALSCFEREKAIYSMLPTNPNILECIQITERGIHLPFFRLGDLRQYLQCHNPKTTYQTRQQWILMAANALVAIHHSGVIHADISARNFLVADDLTIKLCGFSGSAIGEEPALVEEEDRYRLSPDAPRSTTSDLFALGCLIFEIWTGLRPLEEIEDDDYEEIETRYAAGQFPCLDGLPYQDIILKCWTCQYVNAVQLKRDIQNRNETLRSPCQGMFANFQEWGIKSIQQLQPVPSTLMALTISGTLAWLYSSRQFWKAARN